MAEELLTIHPSIQAQIDRDMLAGTRRRLARAEGLVEQARTGARLALKACHEVGKVQRALQLIGAAGPAELVAAVDLTAWALHEIGGYGSEEIAAALRGSGAGHG